MGSHVDLFHPLVEAHLDVNAAVLCVPRQLPSRVPGVKVALERFRDAYEFWWEYARDVGRGRPERRRAHLHGQLRRRFLYAGRGERHEVSWAASRPIEPSSFSSLVLRHTHIRVETFEIALVTCIELLAEPDVLEHTFQFRDELGTAFELEFLEHAPLCVVRHRATRVETFGEVTLVVVLEDILVGQVSEEGDGLVEDRVDLGFVLALQTLLQVLVEEDGDVLGCLLDLVDEGDKGLRRMTSIEESTGFSYHFEVVGAQQTCPFGALNGNSHR